VLGDALEIFNPTEDTVDLGRWEVEIYNEFGVLSDTIGLPEFPLKGRSAVVVSDASGTNNETTLFFPDSLIFWQSNEAGACALLDPDRTGVDFVRWDGSTVPPPAGLSFSGTPPSSAMNAGTSLSRDSRGTDTDNARDWCLRRATLGAQNADECLSDVVRISEIASDSPGGDQVELVNTGRESHNIGNLRLLVYNQDDNLSDTITLPSAVLPPGGRVVIHDIAGTNNSTNIYLNGALIFWEANEPGACALLDGSVHGIDFVRWDESAAALPPGTSFAGAVRSSSMNAQTTLSRDRADQDTDRGSDWCLRPATLGEPNIDECLSDVVRINEIASDSPGGDQIELFNSGALAHNIGNLRLLIYNQNDLLTDTLTLPSFVLPSGGFVVIHDIAGLNNSANIYFNGALVFWEANEPGACALLDGSVHGIDFVRWDGSAVSPPPGAPFNGNNPSGAMASALTLSRRTDGMDTNSGNDWIIDTETLGSPNPQLRMERILEIDLDRRIVIALVTGLELDTDCQLRGSFDLDTWVELGSFRPRAASENVPFPITDGNGKRWFIDARQE
jgi:hypothetical protein